MRIDEYSRLDAHALADLVRRGQVTPQELYDTARSAMLAMDEPLHFLVGETPGEARKNLASLPADAPFRGVPTLIKDIGPRIAGVPQELGSALAAGLVPTQDSELTRRFRDAGMVFMGRTATPELGAAFTTEPRVGPVTRNPWDTSRSTGGSSGGAAAAVSSGVVPVALAGDSAGSIRVPAHCCGLFGLKPTRGRNPTGPEAAEVNSGFTVAHVISRSVRDSAAALDATAGADPGCKYVAPDPQGSFLEAAKRAPDRLRIALSTRNIFGGPLTQDVRRAADQTARLCESLGHTVVEADPPLDGDEIIEVFHVLWAANLYHTVRALEARSGRKASRALLEASTYALFEAGERVSADALLGCFDRANQISRRMGDFFLGHDILLTPAFSGAAPPLGEIRTDAETYDSLAYVRESLAWSPFTSQFNLTGQPAMSVPAQPSAQGLPLGAHFGAAFGGEEILFSLAGQLEAAAPWADRLPPVHASHPVPAPAY
jgi:amidase